MNSCERCKVIEESLPQLADGVPALLGMKVFRVYLGDLWEARVEALHPHALDLVYTNDADHRAKGSRVRGSWARRWCATAAAAKAIAECPTCEGSGTVHDDDRVTPCPACRPVAAARAERRARD